MMQKNIAIGYDRLIFLEAGEYEIGINVYNAAQDANFYIIKNATTANANTNLLYSRADVADNRGFWSMREHFNRGDYVYFYAGAGTWVGTNHNYNNLSIKKLN